MWTVVPKSVRYEPHCTYRCVALDRIGDKKHWFTESAREANAALGEKMATLALDYLTKTII